MDKHDGYKFKNWVSDDDCSDFFLSDLEKDLKLPLDKKTLKFHAYNMLGFKNDLLRLVMKNATYEEFDTTFHSFFKNFPLQEIIDFFYQRPSKNYFTNKQPSSYKDPYVLYLLRQDFRSVSSMDKKLYFNFLNFRIQPNDQQYLELKESLYMFLDNHHEKAKATLMRNTHDTYQQKILKDFELQVHQLVTRHLKKEDYGIFNKFWSSILKSDNAQDMISISEDKFFIFKVNHSYLMNNYPSILNTIYAQKACKHVMQYIQEEFGEHVYLSTFKEDDTFTQIACELKNTSFAQKDIFRLFEIFMNLYEKCEIVKYDGIDKSQKEKYHEEIKYIQTEVHKMMMDNTLSKKEGASFKVKI